VLYTTSSSSSSSDASASCAVVLHPLGAQLRFPTTLGSLDAEVRAVGNAATVLVCGVHVHLMLSRVHMLVE
jgi:hypothetical protein